MSINSITDHAQSMKDRLPSQFNNATNLLALLDLIGARYQGIETLFDDLLNKRSISTATGKQLDGAGTILDTERILGEDDATYRARIFSATSQLEKSGEIESLIELYDFLISPALVRLQEYYPAGVQLTAHDDSDPNDPVVDASNRAAMENVKAGGISLILKVAPEVDDFYLSDVSEVDGSGNGPTDSLHGLGDETLVEGGKLARVY